MITGFPTSRIARCLLCESHRFFSTEHFRSSPQPQLFCRAHFCRCADGAAVLVVMEVTASFLAISRISSDVAATKQTFAQEQERRAAAAAAATLPPLIVEAQPLGGDGGLARGEPHVNHAHGHTKRPGGGAKTLLENTSPEAEAKRKAERIEQDAKEATWNRLKEEAAVAAAPEAGKNHNAAPYPGARTEDEERKLAGDEEEDIGPPMMGAQPAASSPLRISESRGLTAAVQR